MASPDQISRRNFLKAAAAALGVLTLGRLNFPGDEIRPDSGDQTNNPPPGPEIAGRQLGAELSPPSMYYQVGEGDTIASIADRLGSSAGDIIAANPWLASHPDMINSGDIVNIPHFTTPPTIDGVQAFYPDSTVLVKAAKEPKVSGAIGQNFQQGQVTGYEANTGKVKVKLAGGTAEQTVRAQDIQPIGSNFASVVVAANKINGANAIVVGLKDITDGAPVEIKGQDIKSPNPASPLIEIRPLSDADSYDYKGRDVSVTSLKSPNNYPAEWLPATASEIPESSVVLQTATQSTKQGIDRINQWYHDNGVEQANIPYINREDINIVPEGGDRQIQTADGVHFLLYLPWVSDNVMSPAGYLLDPDGNHLINHGFQTVFMKGRELVTVLNERAGHYGQGQAGFFRKWFGQDQVLTDAIETYSKGVAYLAMTAYPEYAARYNSPNIFENQWIKRVISDLDAKGENGTYVLLSNGYTGDMETLRDVYEGHYGKGSFGKMQNEVLRGTSANFRDLWGIRNEAESKLFSELYPQNQRLLT